jgi:hypothetical protein
VYRKMAIHRYLLFVHDEDLSQGKQEKLGELARELDQKLGELAAQNPTFPLLAYAVRALGRVPALMLVLKEDKTTEDLVTKELTKLGWHP